MKEITHIGHQRSCEKIKPRRKREMLNQLKNEKNAEILQVTMTDENGDIVTAEIAAWDTANVGNIGNMFVNVFED